MGKTITLQLVQFMRPSGRPKHVETDIDAKHETSYLLMREEGYRLEAEVLTTEEVSITISNHERDADIRVVEDGPGVQAAIGDMLDARLFTNVPF